MKKVLSILIAICVMLSCSITAFAQEQSQTQKLEAQMDGAVAFLTNGVEKYGVDQAFDYYTLVLSGSNLDKYNEGFLADVKANLDKNNGKIVSSYGESLAVYGSVIMVLDQLLEDPNDFYGYDIVKAFSQLDPTQPQANPYYYRTIIPAANFCDESFSKAVCDTFIKDNYTMGKGMASYGYYGCDSTAVFIEAMSLYADDYPEVMKDAFNVLESYKVDGGYVYDPMYGTEPNADSTGLALMAYASVPLYVEDKDYDSYLAKLNEIYNDLCTFQGKNQGVFIGSYTGEEDYLATKDALMGLEEYHPIIMVEEWFEDEETQPESTTAEPVSQVEEEKQGIDMTSAAAKDTSKKSPATGVGFGAYAAVIALEGAGAVLTVSKRKK